MSQVFDSSGLRLVRSTALARNWWALVLRGALAVAFGIVAFLTPVTALATLVLVYGIYALLDGAFAIVAAGRAAAHHERWGLLLAEGGLGLLIGLLALLAPAAFIAGAVWVLAVWAIITGTLMLTAAAAMHGGHGRWLLGLAGAVSLIWGVLLVAHPFAGAVVLTLWLGAYAVLFGIAMIAFGWRLRARHIGGFTP
jgi:uncharacterized membrane protein HdeD (DUF308 family)